MVLSSDEVAEYMKVFRRTCLEQNKKPGRQIIHPIYIKTYIKVIREIRNSTVQNSQDTSIIEKIAAEKKLGTIFKTTS